MELDTDDSETIERMTTDTSNDDDEPLPTIAIGSENWHSNFSAPWIPMIHRDLSRQRRQVSGINYRIKIKHHYLNTNHTLH